MLVSVPSSQRTFHFQFKNPHGTGSTKPRKALPTITEACAEEHTPVAHMSNGRGAFMHSALRNKGKTPPPALKPSSALVPDARNGGKKSYFDILRAKYHIDRNRPLSNASPSAHHVNPVLKENLKDLAKAEIRLTALPALFRLKKTVPHSRPSHLDELKKKFLRKVGGSSAKVPDANRKEPKFKSREAGFKHG